MVSGTGSSSASNGGELLSADVPIDGAFDYMRLHLEVTGAEAGEPVLLLHGWGSSAENMRAIARALEDTYRVYNVDLPGHGHSPAPPEPIGVPEHARLVADLIRGEIGAPVNVIGHSNGGRIALFMAADPEMKSLFRRLVLISPSGIRPHRSAGFYVKKYTAQMLKAPFTVLPGPLREFGLDWLRHSLVWRLLGSSDYRSLEGPMRGTFVKTVTHHLDERVHEIDVPTLIIWGDRDTAISRRQIRILEERIPDAGTVILEKAGHYGYLDDFDTFIGSTRYFLENA